jgi:hypothetical protein
MACPQKAVATNPVPDLFLELATAVNRWPNWSLS